jgi:putative polyhydroxyalkanoate system protein
MPGSKISVSRAHRLNREQAVRAADRIADELKARHGIQSRWKDDTLHFKRSGVSGTLTLGEGKLDIKVELGFLLAMFRDTIASEIERALDRELTEKPADTKHNGA